MKVSNDELRRRLNLVNSSKVFVLKELGDNGNAAVQSCQKIPNDDGIYWVGGKTKLKNRRGLVSVFRVDTNAAGDLLSIYWLIDGEWYEHDSAETFNALGIERDDAFPFEWSYAIALENDAFHSE